jgi:type 1 fimbriae regulatory protein FimB/type 1 fimbriae regulatory protein FimE
MAESNIIPEPEKRQAGCQNDCFDNQARIASSKTAGSATVVQLRPTTILTTRAAAATRAGYSDRRTYLTENEVEELIKAAPTARDRTMILVGYTHGLRVSELVNLRWSQIKFDTGRIAIKRLKKGEDSEHVLRGREIRALKALRREQPAGSQFIFLTYQGAPMTRQAFHKMLRAAGAKAGIPDVHAHLLRHGCGYRLVNTGMDTLSLAAYLGHANVQNTKLYTKMNASRFEGLWQD